MKFRFLKVGVIVFSFAMFFASFCENQAFALSTSTVSVSVSNQSPSLGSAITLTATVTSGATGTVTFKDKYSDALCSPVTLVGSIASCVWTPSLISNDLYVYAIYSGDGIYASSSSNSSMIPITAKGISNIYISRLASGTQATISIASTLAGTVTLKANGTNVSGCVSQSIISNKNCTYTPDGSKSTIQFTVDLIPTDSNYPTMFDQAARVVTLDSFYLPNGDNVDTARNNYPLSNADGFKTAGFLRVNNIFYKLNRSTHEAIVIGYDRFSKVTSIAIPETITIDSSVTGATYLSGDYSLFYGTYEISYIGQRAFAVEGGYPYDSANTPNIQSVSLPSTLKVIGDEAFYKQCDIGIIVIPDSVQEIGDNAFAYMSSRAQGNTNPFTGCTGSDRGISEIVVGSGVKSLHGSVFRSNANLTKLSFRGSGPELFSSLKEYSTDLDNWQSSGTGRSYVVSGQTWGHCTSHIVYMGSTVTLNVLSLSSQAWIDWGSTSNCLPSGANRSVVLSRFTPSQPAQPVPANATRTSVDLSFSTSQSDGGSPIDYYEITTLPATSITRFNGPVGGSVVIQNLTPATSYQFKVLAHNIAQVASGNILAYSGGNSVASASSASITTLPPAAPSSPVIGTVNSLSSSSISIPYTAGANNGSAITGYTVTSSDGLTLTRTSSSTSNPLTYSGSFVQGQAYTFSMTATNGAGTSLSSSSSNSVTPYAAAAPAAGVIGSVTRVSDTSVSVPFTAPSSNGSTITAYTISSSPAVSLSYSGTSSPMAVSGTFAQGQSYTFTIAATNGAGTGAMSSSSNGVIAFAAAKPDAPIIGSATLVDSQTVTVGFSAPLSNHGSVITSYRATSNPGAITTTSTGSPITVTGLTVNTAYTFTVTATNSVGESDSSTATIAVTPLMSYAVTFNSQSGSSIANGTFVSGSTVSPPSAPPTRSGYTFNGWFAASTGGSALVFPYAPGVTTAITLFAQWTLIPVVVPVVAAPVAQSGPPPSILKSITSPKVSRDEKGFYCEIGKYVFLRDGRTEELPKLTLRVFSLMANGKVTETIKSTLDKVAFTKNELLANVTTTCQVEAGQENLVTTTSSLNSVLIAKYSQERKLAIEAIYVKYYKDRTDAYAKKSQEFARVLSVKTSAMNSAKTTKAKISASIVYQKAFSAASSTWKKELVDATKNRDLAKALAQKQYLDALEVAGVSIFQTN